MPEKIITEDDYLDVINKFYVFWKQHIYDYPKHFKYYLSEGTLRNRLSFNIHDSTWYLLVQDELEP
jgi:hypothetical protein